MFFRPKNSYLLLEVLVCFFILAVSLPLVYPLFKGRRDQVENWKRLRQLQEQAELTFLEVKLQLQELEPQNIYSKSTESFFYLDPEAYNLTFSPKAISLKKLKSSPEEEWIELTIEYGEKKSTRSSQISQIFCLKKNKFDMRK